LVLSEQECKSDGKSRTTLTASESSKSIGLVSSGTEMSEESNGQKSSQLTLSAEASPASQSPLPAQEKETRTIDGSGLSSFEPFGKYDPSTHSWRMYLGCSQLTMGDLPEECSGTWPRSGTMQSGISYRQPMSELPTSEKESSLLPTPASREPGWRYIEVVDKNGQPPEHWNQRFYDKESGRVVQKGLTQIARLWPTPTRRDWKGETRKNIALGNPKRHLDAEVMLWRTPNASDGQRGQGINVRQRLRGKWNRPSGQRLQMTLHTQVLVEKLLDEGYSGEDQPEAISGQLNPEWVGWLMGFPIGWTDLSASGTPSSRKSQSISENSSSKRKE